MTGSRSALRCSLNTVKYSCFFTHIAHAFLILQFRAFRAATGSIGCSLWCSWMRFTDPPNLVVPGEA